MIKVADYYKNIFINNKHFAITSNNENIVLVYYGIDNNYELVFDVIGLKYFLVNDLEFINGLYFSKIEIATNGLFNNMRLIYKGKLLIDLHLTFKEWKLLKNMLLFLMKEYYAS